MQGRGLHTALRVVEGHAQLVAGCAPLVRVDSQRHQVDEIVDRRQRHRHPCQRRHAQLLRDPRRSGVNVQALARHRPRRRPDRHALGWWCAGPRRRGRLLGQHGRFGPGVAVPPAPARPTGRVGVPPWGRTGVSRGFAHADILPKPCPRPGLRTVAGVRRFARRLASTNAKLLVGRPRARSRLVAPGGTRRSPSRPRWAARRRGSAGVSVPRRHDRRILGYQAENATALSSRRLHLPFRLGRSVGSPKSHPLCRRSIR